MSELKTRVLDISLENPEWAAYLSRILKYEDMHKDDEYFHIGWTWRDVLVPAHVLYQLAVKHGILRLISRSSRGPAYYLLVDREAVRDALMEYEKLSIAPPAVVEKFEGLPPDLFNDIVDLDAVKELIKRSLSSEKPTHVLLIGPVSTCKTLIVTDGWRKVPGAELTLGSRSTKSGIAGFLIEREPRILIIDELDKMKAEDMASLLSVMETGVIATMMHRRRITKELKLWVLATANTTRGIPQELLSRFARVWLREYTDDEFDEVTEKVLTRREGIDDPELARYIARKVRTSLKSRDVRDCVRCARLLKEQTKEDVNRVIGLLMEHRPNFRGF